MAKINMLYLYLVTFHVTFIVSTKYVMVLHFAISAAVIKLLLALG